MKKKQKTRSRSGKNQFNRSIMRVSLAVCAVFAAMICYFLYFVQVRSAEVIGSSYNPRIDRMAEQIVRGKIKTADGVIIAKTELEADGTETRVYPHGRLFAPVTGYVQKGRTGVESLANFYLLSSHVNLLEQTGKELLGQKSPGDHVWLTIDYELQAAASEALGDRDGAVIAMEPETGRLLCMVSKPGFDPNTIAEDWEALSDPENDRGQLLNRAAQGVYPPGSTFKLLPLIAYVHEHPEDYGSFRFDCGGVYTDRDGNEIRCYGGTAHGMQTLSEAFANSCNGAFASLSEELSAEALKELSETLLFNTKLPYPLPYSESRFRLKDEDSAFLKAQTMIGQGETTMSPLHNLLLTAAIANGGELMQPMLFDHLENAGGERFKVFRPKRFGALFSEEDAALLKELMRKVVTDGTGSAFRDASYEICAKTGSAEYMQDGSKKTHAWCNAFAEKDGRGIAVCVIAEDADSGGRTAAPIARKVLDNWLLK